MPDDLLDAPWTAFPPVPTEDWWQKIAQDLKGADPAERLSWQNLEGIEGQPFYRAEDLAALPAGAPAPIPGLAGRARTWRLRQDVAATDLAETNRQAHTAIEGGVEALGFRFGGPQGLSVENETALRRLLDNLPLDSVALHFEVGAEARSLLRMLLDETDRRGLEAAALRGGIVFDPITVLLQQGRLVLDAALNETTRLFAAAEEAGTPLRTLAADAQPVAEAGGSAVQELAVALASANELLAHLTDQGFDAARIAQRLTFVVPVGTRYFTEIAKLRALRLLFAQMLAAYGGDAPAHLHAVTSRWHQTRYDPYTNLLRATTAAAAALVGGCDVLRVRPHDEVAGPPSDDALRLARNIPLILRHEGYLGTVADAGAGAYHLEALTDALAQRAWALFQQIEARGGLVAALRDGFVQAEIGETRARQRAAVASGRQAIVGVTRFPDADETRLDAYLDAAPVEATTTEAAGAIEIEPLPVGRLAEPVEAMRLRTERHVRETGQRPRVLLLKFGDAVMANARATFARNYFGTAGFALREADELGEADIVVLCSADDDYAAHAPALIEENEDALVVVAGDPRTITGDWTTTVSGFIHRKTHLLDTLTGYQQRLGINER